MTYQETQMNLSATLRTKAKFSLRRVLMGGNIGDLGRFPRYLAFVLLGGAAIWMPITGYLETAPLTFKSSTSLILPGSGAAASMNLNGIGQASSFANSAFSSNSVSPTETYKRLIGADRIVDAAAKSMGMTRKEFGKPRISLVDLTSLIHLEMTGGSAEDAQARGNALLDAFFEEIDKLRADELATREDSGLAAIESYRTSVAATRKDIADLQKSTGLISGDQYDAMVGSTRTLEIRVQDITAQLDEKRENIASLEATLGIPANAAADTLKLFADAEFNSLIAEIGNHAAALTEARSSFGPGHPKVQSLQSAYDAAKSAALSQAARVTGLPPEQLQDLDLAPAGARADLLSQLVRMNAERSGTETQLTTLTNRLENEQSKLANLAAPAARLQDLQRDFSVAEAVFATAIARTQSTKSDIYASYPLVQVLENPSLPDEPSSPNVKLAYAAGVAATFMLIVGLFLGWMRSAMISSLLKKPKEKE